MDIYELSDKDLGLIKEVLREYPQTNALDLIYIIKDEEERRRQSDLDEIEITRKFYDQYVRFDLEDGIGSYEVWKVKSIKNYGNKMYSIYPEELIVSNVDGAYSIDRYLEDVTIETTNDLKKFTVISKEDYDAEFEKAIEYIRSLKDNLKI